MQVHRGLEAGTLEGDLALPGEEGAHETGIALRVAVAQPGQQELGAPGFFRRHQQVDVGVLPLRDAAIQLQRQHGSLERDEAQPGGGERVADADQFVGHRQGAQDMRALERLEGVLQFRGGRRVGGKLREDGE